MSNTSDWMNDSPFEHTVIKPRIARSAPLDAPVLDAKPALQTAVQAAEPLWNTLNWGRLDGGAEAIFNPLLEAATPLLRMAVQFKTHTFDARNLSQLLSQSVQEFEQQALVAGCDKVEVEAARYILCTLLDECAGNTPWGGSGVWAKHSLLLIHFRETWGGEKVFQLLARFQKDPKRFIMSLELLAVCMSLGFKGKFHIQHEGDLAHQALRTQLAGLIRATRNDPGRRLAPDAASTAPQQMRAVRWIPWWIAPASSAGAVLVLFTALLFQLNAASDQAAQVISQLRLPTPDWAPLTVKPPQNDWFTELQSRLKPELNRGELRLVQQGQDVWVELGGDALFDSGKDELKDRAQALLQSVGLALSNLPAELRVVGHTDNQTMRSLRFPSNHALSEARAQRVSRFLLERQPQLQISTEGAGDTQPVADNRNAEGRQLNRRVTLQLKPNRAAAPTGQAPIDPNLP